MMKRTILFFTLSLFLMMGCQPGGKDTQKEAEEKAATGTDVNTPEKEKKKKILFFGNSLTAGYGLEEEESFPSLVQQRIDSLNLNYTVINAGLSGETTAGGKERLAWIMKQPIDIFVLELGGNDVLRGIDPVSSSGNLRNIIEQVKAKFPDIPVIIAGMQAPPNMGPEYVNIFEAIYPQLAEDFEAGLIPFLLEGVAGDPSLNLPDGIHPNPEGQKIVLENVWRVLEGYL